MGSAAAGVEAPLVVPSGAWSDARLRYLSEVSPRSSGGQPQRILTTLFGDYWPGRVPMPATAMAAVAAEFGITPAGTRMALHRMVARGVLQAERIGRQSGFRAPPSLRPLLDEAVRRIFRFGRSPRPWDGTWTTVAFSLPEDHRSMRHTLRTRLRWMGFAPLYDGLWVCPHAMADQAAALLAELGVTTATVLTGTTHPASPPGGDPIRAWDLAALRASYEGFIRRFAGDRARVLAGRVGAAEALVIRTELMDCWRAFSNADPDLPVELLPADWPLPAAARLFAEIYDGLALPAAGRFADLVSSVAPSLAGEVRYRTTDAPEFVAQRLHPR